MLTFQELIEALNRYWADQGCLLLQPYDVRSWGRDFSPGHFLEGLWDPNPGRRPMSNLPGGRPTVATGKTPTACSTITSTRSSLNLLRWKFRTST